jgi:sugar porter (SP) family MFS transporter
MGLSTNPHAEALVGATVALFFAGGFFGALSTWWVADRFGRKGAIALASTIILISGALSAGSVNITMFIVFRFFAGWGTLMIAISVPLWIAEIAPSNSRGVLAGMHALMANIGYTTSAYVGVGFHYYNESSSAQWRAPVAFICLGPLVNLIILPFVPESPRYLVTRGRDETALEILKRVHSRANDKDHEYAKAEFYQIQKQEELDKHLSTTWGEILRRPSYRKRMLIASSLTVFCNTCGPLVITNYAANTFKGLGFSVSQNLLFIAGFGPVSIFGMLISLLYVDKVPRNKMIALGIILCTIALSCEAAVTARFLGTTNKGGLAAGVAFVFVFIFFYNLVLEGPSWWYNAEIFPTHLRAKGMTTGICVFCLCNILWLQLAPTAFANIGWKFYLVFICISCASATTVYFIYPDTLNKPLEEVAMLFGDHDLVAIYQQDIIVDHERHEVVTKEEVTEAEHAVDGLLISEKHMN